MFGSNTPGGIRDWLAETEVLRLTYTRGGLSVQTKSPEGDEVRTTPLQGLTAMEQRCCWRYAFDPAGWRWIASDPARQGHKDAAFAEYASILRHSGRTRR